MLVVLLAATAWGRSIDLSGKAVAVTTIGGIDYVALGDVCAAVAARSWRVGSRLIVALPARDSTAVGEELVFRVDSAVVLGAGRRIRLSSPPVLRDSEMYVPAASATELFVPGERRGGAVAELVAVGDTVVLRLRLEGARVSDTAAAWGESRSSLEYRLTLAAGVDSVALERARQVARADSGLLKSIGRSGGTLLLGFRRPASVRLDRGVGRVEVRCWPRPERRIGRIVLDPGHGGPDPGAIGRARQTLEKNITLDVAARLKGKLEKLGYEVAMTRESDGYVSLADRSRAAARHRADLFVSIHANAAPNRAACGLETYFLSEAKTDWERAVAARENAEVESLAGASYGPGDVGLILADLAQSEFLLESSELAGRIQELTFPRARVMDRGVRQANFYVLRNTFIPAVLVEVGFLSNKSEEGLLRQASHRDKLADGIASGIDEFCRSYSRRVNGNGGRGGK
jgi:N-acetylmuramoyl-L-alanine amidase